MPGTSASDRGQLGFKLEGDYPTNFGVPQATLAGFLVAFTGESFNFDVSTDTSKTIRPDRQIVDQVMTGAKAGGGFTFEHIFRNCEPLLEAVLQGTWSRFGTAGLGAAVTGVTLAPGSITVATAPTGANAFTTLQRGRWFRIVPPAGATPAATAYLRGRAFRVHPTTAPTATVLTLDPSTPINLQQLGAAVGATTLAYDGIRLSSSRLVNGSRMQTFTAEVGHTDIGVYRVYTGMTPDKFEMTFASGSILGCSMDFAGKSMVTPMPTATTLGGTNTVATGGGPARSASTFESADAVRGIFDIFLDGTSVTATAFVKSGKLSIANNVRAQDAVGIFGAAGVAAGTFSVTGELEVYLADSNLYERFLRSQTMSLAIPVLDPSGAGYIYEMTRLKFSAAKANIGGQNQDNMISLSIQGLMQTDTNSGAFGSTLAIYGVSDT